jgi:hypothetical protein
MQKKLHIVSFNVPYPADYGGVIDVFNRILTLHRLGVEVHLHTFTYGRPPAAELERLCASVTYYRRRTGLRSVTGRRPYIVESRDNKELIANLQRDDAPILLEGLHCCSVLEALEGRRILVRAHNVEHEYYAHLAAAEHSLFRRIYLRCESRWLRRYEPVLLKADAVLAVTEADAAHFRSIGCQRVLLMPSSHNDDEVVSLAADAPGEGRGYVLYHADLSVPENVDAVDYLKDNLFCRSGIRFVVAGRNPSKQMAASLAALPNVELVANPDDDAMHSLIANAQVLMLFTNAPTGLKLKLLNSLYAGRHCLVNSAMVAGTDLGRLCTVADTAAEQLEALDRLMHTPFTPADIEQRRHLLGALYSNEASAKILLSEISDQ